MNYPIRISTTAAAVLLFVTTACSGNRTVGQRIDDSVITTKIESKLTADPEVSAFRVDVDTEDGVVRLSGVVKHEKARSEAADLARDTHGVREVINDIVVGNQTMGERLDDAGMTAKVKAKLAADPQVNPFKIDVDTTDAIVTLSGSVSSSQAKEEAEKHARSVKNVKDVRNMLKVNE